MAGNPRSTGFRHVYGQTFSIRYDGVSFVIKFGVKEDHQVGDDSFTEEIAVVLPPQGAKLLTIMLGAFVGSLEKSSGQEIVVDPSRIQAVENFLATRAQNSHEGANGAAAIAD